MTVFIVMEDPKGTCHNRLTPASIRAVFNSKTLARRFIDTQQRNPDRFSILRRKVRQ